MKENQIPTPNFSTFSDIEKAKDHVLGHPNQLVIKADGLAAGKGVFVSAILSTRPWLPGWI